MNKLFIRMVQLTCALYIKCLKEPKQQLYVGDSSTFELVKEMKKKGIKKVFVVTDPTIIRLNLIGPLLDSLKHNNINYTLYSDVESDPCIETVEKGFNLYNENNCDCLLAVGGGSVLDCAKAIGARVSDPKRGILKLKRLIGGVKKFTIPFMAIPTTSGTGSENTLYALITNKQTRQKYPLLSNKYIPTHVALDAKLTVNLPLSITSYTGMDALTHAIEAYVSTSSKLFKKDKKEGLEATKMILNNLEKVYLEPTNLKYRENMAIASYKAGLAFRRISIGYVHNISHRMGEFYHIPHGLANAIVLPYIIEFMMPIATKQLSELAIYSKLGTKEETEEQLANKLLNKIKELSKLMKIPEHIKEIKEEDLDLIVKRALKESYFCGNPRLMSKKECRELLLKIKGN